MKNTPYDDVFRTLLNDCSALIIPVINEAFGEHYTGKERIVFSPNEHFINRQDGAEEERITDSSFRILSDKPKKYHCECQSNDDSSMLVRFFEYDAQIALDDGKVRENVLTVEFPHSAVLFLRSSADTPERMRTRIDTPGGSVSYDIVVIKLQRYSIDEIFDKNLLFLIPFYIFSHESRFKKYENDRAMPQNNRSDALTERFSRRSLFCFMDCAGNYEGMRRYVYVLKIWQNTGRLTSIRSVRYWICQARCWSI